MPRPLIRIVAPLVAGLVAVGSLVSASIEQAATVTETADRDRPPVRDLAVAFDTGPVDQFVVDGVTRAVASVGGFSARSRNASVGLIRIARNGSTVHAPRAAT